MTVCATEITGTNLLAIEIVGKLSKSDYEYFLPKIEKLIDKYGKLRLLVEVDDFHGWTAWSAPEFNTTSYESILQSLSLS